MSSKPQVTFASKHQMLPIKRAASAPQTSTFSKSDASNQSILPVTQASPISSDAKFLQSYHFQETHMEDRTETHIDSTHPDSKVDEADLPLLSQNSLLSPSSDITDLALTTPSPSKSTFSRLSIDEEKFSPPATLKQTKALHRQRILDISQRATSLILSIIILVVMANAYRTFLANKNVTAGGQAIYPTFMALWPTYMMIAAGAVTVVLNACVVFWRVRGHIKDEKREEMYNKAWDYLLHGINCGIWLASSSTFHASKNLGGAIDPNALWGYTCSPTAKKLNEQFPEIIKFYVQCQVQTVSFWMSVSAVLVEGFAVLTKVFVRK
ncbi:hypothetical protein DL95DRAFT_506279 [Leptodontidium sp. 2 PMI_412]|nr:hypothetical protein DL95DRAFT_506279 [Leptodontidium sp. 2 PMI_412]